eukprot:3118399-Prymnesium_polylepis.1
MHSGSSRSDALELWRSDTAERKRRVGCSSVDADGSGPARVACVSVSIPSGPSPPVSSVQQEPAASGTPKKRRWQARGMIACLVIDLPGDRRRYHTQDD